jgi:hypothetical protein
MTCLNCNLASVDFALLIKGKYNGTDKLAKIPIIAIASNNSNIVNAPSFFDFNI